MKSGHGKHWRALAYEWQEIGGMRQAALERVWLLADTLEDQSVAKEIRDAIVGDFVTSDD